MKARRPVWKILAAVAAVLLLGIGIFFAWVQAVANRRWSALEKRVPELIAEARARDPRRPVLRGEAVPGSAWVDYNAGLAAVKGLSFKDLSDWIDGAASATREKAEAVVLANEKLLDFVRAGARKAEGTYPVPWEKGFSCDIPSLKGVQNLTHLAAGKARLLAEAGKLREAADLLLDAAQFGADMGRNTILIATMISVLQLGTLFEEMRRLPPDAELGKALARLDVAFPDLGEALRNEAVSAGAGFVGVEGEGLIAGSGFASWRYGFSTRLQLVDAWTLLDRMMRGGAEASRRPWAETERIGAELQAELVDLKNPTSRLFIPGLLQSNRAYGERRAQLRLLRRLHGETGPLDDPFGGKLRSDGVKAWSVGADGVDGGGTGVWKPAKTGDIVLELPKK